MIRTNKKIITRILQACGKDFVDIQEFLNKLKPQWADKIKEHCGLCVYSSAPLR